nr:transposase [Candidatus Electrothrix aestuarii]
MVEYLYNLKLLINLSPLLQKPVGQDLMLSEKFSTQFFIWFTLGVNGEKFRMISQSGPAFTITFVNGSGMEPGFSSSRQFTEERREQGKNAEPSAVMIDSQSVKTAQMAETRGFDGNKKVKGRKRHVISDTLGFPLIVKVHDANLSDGKQSISIFQTLFLWFASIKMV